MKRYIDFVQRPKTTQGKAVEPAAYISVPEKKPVKQPVSQPQTHRAPVVTHKVMDMSAPVRRPIRPVGIDAPIRRVAHPAPSTTVMKPAMPPKPAHRPVEKPVEKSVEKPVEKGLEGLDSIFGVIEDYHPAKQPEKVSKRPLSTPDKHFKKQPSIEDELEALEKEENENATPVAEESTTKHSNKFNDLLKVGKSPFIRTNAIEKRPLSNSAKKPAVKTPKEELSDPATIIEKPEKDAHVGIIITVILTIIFGAAIGTAAFLLLPKH